MQLNINEDATIIKKHKIEDNIGLPSAYIVLCNNFNSQYSVKIILVNQVNIIKKDCIFELLETNSFKNANIFYKNMVSTQKYLTNYLRDLK